MFLCLTTWESNNAHAMPNTPQNIAAMDTLILNHGGSTFLFCNYLLVRALTYEAEGLPQA